MNELMMISENNWMMEITRSHVHESGAGEAFFITPLIKNVFNILTEDSCFYGVHCDIYISYIWPKFYVWSRGWIFNIDNHNVH